MLEAFLTSAQLRAALQHAGLQPTGSSPLVGLLSDLVMDEVNFTPDATLPGADAPLPPSWIAALHVLAAPTCVLRIETSRATDPAPLPSTFCFTSRGGVLLRPAADGALHIRFPYDRERLRQWFLQEVPWQPGLAHTAPDYELSASGVAALAAAADAAREAHFSALLERLPLSPAVSLERIRSLWHSTARQDPRWLLPIVRSLLPPSRRNAISILDGLSELHELRLIEPAGDTLLLTPSFPIPLAAAPWIDESVVLTLEGADGSGDRAAYLACHSRCWQLLQERGGRFTLSGFDGTLFPLRVEMLLKRLPEIRSSHVNGSAPRPVDRDETILGGPEGDVLRAAADQAIERAAQFRETSARLCANCGAAAERLATHCAGCGLMLPSRPIPGTPLPPVPPPISNAPTPAPSYPSAGSPPAGNGPGRAHAGSAPRTPVCSNPGCGRPFQPGQRFCTICGSPAAR